MTWASRLWLGPDMLYERWWHKLSDIVLKRQNCIKYLKGSTGSSFQASMPLCSILSLVARSPVFFSCDLLPFHICLHVFSLLFYFYVLAQHALFFHSFPRSHLFLVMLAPCPSCSLPYLTCHRTAVMKILRRRRILHGFSLGPGTPLHGVG